jgi:hypothetical protein
MQTLQREFLFKRVACSGCMKVFGHASGMQALFMRGRRGHGIRRSMADGARGELPGRDSAVTATVVIPVHESARELTRCLESLRRSDFTDYECIVVDDGSSQAIRPIVEAHRCRYLRLDRRGGAARARNRGAAEQARLVEGHRPAIEMGGTLMVRNGLPMLITRR